MATMAGSAYNRINRTAEGRPLEGIRAASADALLEFLGADQVLCVAADLSLGAWRGCQAAAELEEQLGLVPTGGCGIELASREAHELLPAYADFVGRAIDAESSGDRTVIDALGRARRIAAAMGACHLRACLILAPRFQLPWEQHDLLLLRFLVEAARGSEWRVLLVAGGEEEPNGPFGWPVRWRAIGGRKGAEVGPGVISLVPGTFGPELASLSPGVEARFPLRAGRWLVPPEWRHAPARVSSLLYDKLAAAPGVQEWLRAYAQYYGNNLFVDPQFLCRQAAYRLAEGGGNIAIRLAERAAACARSAELSSMCQSYAQGIRIATRQYQSAADGPDPPPSAPPPVRGFLMQCKGWGLALTGAGSRAEEYFSEARRLLGTAEHKREFLYLLNISALAALRAGDFDRALELEHGIEASLAAQRRTDWHLRYINSINLARLYMRCGNMQRAAVYYQSAFETADGVRSESDAVYFNFCMARVWEREGRVDAALRGWLRVCLHWLASSVPEALAPRVVQGILGRAPANGEEVVEKVSGALAFGLRRIADEAGISLENGSRRAALAFIRSGDAASLPPPGGTLLAFGMEGCGVLASTEARVVSYRGPYHASLGTLVEELLRKLAQPEAEFQTIIVDDRFGREIPGTASELASVCVRLGVGRMQFNNSVYRFDRESRANAEMAARVSLGAAVDTVEFADVAATVRFKRYLPPSGVQGDGATILYKLAPRAHAQTVGAIARSMERSQEAVLRALRELERRRMVSVDLGDDCWKA